MKHPEADSHRRYELDPEAEFDRQLRQALQPPHPSLGLAARIARKAVSQPPEPAAHAVRWGGSPRWRMAWVALGLLIIGLGAGLWQHHVRRLAQERQALQEANYALRFTRKQMRSILLEAVPHIRLNSQL